MSLTIVFSRSVLRLFIVPTSLVQVYPEGEGDGAIKRCALDNWTSGGLGMIDGQA